MGNTCLSIGILIAMAAIIGKCLMDSGAAERIVFSMRRLVGEKHTPVAFVGSGFLIGIPVFFDTLFYLLMPLGKALRVRTGKNYLLYVLAIVAGGTTVCVPGPFLGDVSIWFAAGPQDAVTVTVQAWHLGSSGTSMVSVSVGAPPSAPRPPWVHVPRPNRA